MELGMIGLGRMGANMVQRLLRAGHACAVYDLHPQPVLALAKEGRGGRRRWRSWYGVGGTRTVWLMVPPAVVDRTLEGLVPLLQEGDTVVDGGNSHYQDDLRRARELGARGLQYLDVGVSGGIWGLERGFCQMIGGQQEAVAQLEPVFAALAPGVGAATRTEGREGAPGPAEQGYLHSGPSGAGHFVKMVHNGIEYGLIAAYAEGLNVLRHTDEGTAGRANTGRRPRHPELYQYSFHLDKIAEVWRRGSVIGSWLLDRIAHALQRSRTWKNSPASSRTRGKDAGRSPRRWTSRCRRRCPRGPLRALRLPRPRVRGQGDVRHALRVRGRLEKPTGE